MNVAGAGILTVKFIVAVSLEAKPSASVSLILKGRLLSIDYKSDVVYEPLYSIVWIPSLLVAMEKISFSSADINSNEDGAWVPSTMDGNVATVEVTPGVKDNPDGTTAAKSGVLRVCITTFCVYSENVPIMSVMRILITCVFPASENNAYDSDWMISQ